ncbi:CoA pyrophosphatase [Methylobacterium goesingense]|uniref:8-oxo-dGTP pyrophosphatase MutT (NUDIX family) n=1 Tax=Methylobacterium goesingense TaxID=243690 RepID=A0ABV2L7U1_9HYPH|nr:CoA pyrophosphatase [Methylobacterium goesingense]GJD75740.1 putative Nudix hydrolase NudL [Methylobacterium goesingense]
MTHDDPLADLLARAAAHLCAEPPGDGAPTANPRGDHDLDGPEAAVVPKTPHRRAAVLVPVLPRADGLHVLFTVRAAHLRDHSGQIAFPGGKIDADDASPAHAALREAREEVGLVAEAIRVLGYLDPYLSATGFLVLPVLGLVDPRADLCLNPDEVAATFEVPLRHLLDPTQRRIESAVWRGRQRRYYAITYGEFRIWGVTAGIVNNLRERLFP